MRWEPRSEIIDSLVNIYLKTMYGISNALDIVQNSFQILKNETEILGIFSWAWLYPY